ncbi:hypothetical protein [Chachezhania sediminis]|uniref:hypothetical protein n=1 Tax=Chachezhania sediminis TaxID=2599291 RepID=UPI00131CB223|nr:hypothetical protein [Chachezhania sediminis]
MAENPTGRRPGGQPRETGPSRPGTDREDRLKAALKANMARRKAQARARASVDATGDNEGDAQTSGSEER